MPLAIASWLACLAIVLVIGLLILKVAKEIRGRPEAAEVQTEAAGLYMRKRDCEKMHANLDARVAFIDAQRTADVKEASTGRRLIYVEVEGVRKEMVEMERRLNKADEDRTISLHNRLNEILAEVSEVRGQIRGTRPIT